MIKSDSLMLENIHISNKCCSFGLFLFICESWKIQCISLVSSKILCSTTVFNIDNNQKCFLSSKSVYYYDFWKSCDTEDWSNDHRNKLNQWKAYLFSFQMMHKSQLKKIDPYDWFCGPGSHMSNHNLSWIIFPGSRTRLNVRITAVGGRTAPAGTITARAGYTVFHRVRLDLSSMCIIRESFTAMLHYIHATYTQTFHSSVGSVYVN